MNVSLLFVVALALLLASVHASSHSEAPGTANAPLADNADFYMFNSYETGRQDYVTFLVNIRGLQDTFGGPNYFTMSERHFYEIYVDNNGDGEEDVTFQFYFGSRLGGKLESRQFEEDDDDCHFGGNFVTDPILKKRSWTPEPRKITIKKYGSVALNIGGKDITIPLKVFGPNTCTTGGVCSEGGLNWFEHYYINQVLGDRSKGLRETVRNAKDGAVEFRKPFDYAGEKSFPQYDTYARTFIHDIKLPSCAFNGRVFVGQRQDPFNINLGQVFDLVNIIPIPGLDGTVKGIEGVVSVAESDSNNALRRKAVTTIALEVHRDCLFRGSVASNGVLSSWTGVRRLLHIGDDHLPGKQVSRLGNPLVNELLIGIDNKGYWNRRHVRYDAEFNDYINYPTFPAILDLLFGDFVRNSLFPALGVPTLTGSIAPQVFPRADLFAIFYTGVAGVNKPPNVLPCDQLRLNVSIAASTADKQSPFGVVGGDLAGFPNGRRPGDDVVDIVLRGAMGVLLVPTGAKLGEGPAPVGLVAFTDGAPLNAGYVDSVFPYLRTPSPGSAVGFN